VDLLVDKVTPLFGIISIEWSMVIAVNASYGCLESLVIKNANIFLEGNWNKDLP
jgi:hypothetical protein